MAKKKARKVSTAITKAKGPRPSVFPAHLGVPPAEWRAKKRQEWLEVTQAIARYTYGSAYAPGNRQLWDMTKYAEEVTELVAGDWVAW